MDGRMMEGWMDDGRTDGWMTGGGGHEGGASRRQQTLRSSLQVFLVC